MILKLRTNRAALGESWRYLDRVRDLQTYGPLTDGSASSEDRDVAAGFTNFRDLKAAVDRTWGDSRDFDAEVWPDLPGEDAQQGGEKVGPFVETAVARTDDGRAILVIVADEAYLLGDDGRTVDRLR